MRAKFWANETLSGKGFEKTREKNPKMRRPYPKFSPCNSCATLECRGDLPRVWGAEEHSENRFFSLKISIGTRTVSSRKGEIASAGLSATAEEFLCSLLIPGISLYSTMLFFSYLFFGGGLWGCDIFSQ